MLVGNKSDLDSVRTVPTEEAQDFAGPTSWSISLIDLSLNSYQAVCIDMHFSSVLQISEELLCRCFIPMYVCMLSNVIV